MNFLDKLVDEARASLGDLIRNAATRDVENALDRLDRGLDTRALEEIVYPVKEVYGRDAERASDRDFDDMVKKYGRIVAEATALQCLNEYRLTRDLTRKEEDNLRSSMDRYGEIVDDAKREARRSDRRDDDRRDDSRRSRRNDRDDKKRHTSSFERDGDERKSNREEGRRNESRRQEKEEEIIVEKLNDGEVITGQNYALLPSVLKDLPFYYVGIEELVYSEDQKKVLVQVLEGDRMFNYEKHRTDIFLSPNRDPNNIGMVVEDLDKKMKEASLNKVKAFIEEEENKDKPELEHSTKVIKITKSSVLDGIYDAHNRAIGAEHELRDLLTEVIEEPKWDEHVIALTIEHRIDDLENIDRTSDEFVEFIEITQRLSVETKLNDIKAALLIAQKIFCPATYDIIYRIYNDAVCNALSTTLKLGIKTTSILRDWSDIEKLINSVYEDNPQIVPIIDMNLCSALPTLFEASNGLCMYRNYIFVPVIKTDFTVASPIRYATINQSDRSEMFGVINKLLTTNVPQESYKALTTLVTLDNYSLPVFKNRTILNDSGYYVFQPI